MVDITKLIFEAIDKIFNKSQNEEIEILGSENIKVLKDKRYSRSKSFDCLLDCYYDEKKKGKFPVVFYIHGGGFVAGGKEYRKALATWYASQGFFVVNVNYGLSPECVFPKPIKHLVAALNWTKNHAETFNLDLEKIVVAGDSAGAYFASMIACVTENNELQKKLGVSTDVHFKATILNCGIYDMASILDKHIIFKLNDKIFESYTGIKKNEIQKYKYKNYCSPLSLVDKNFPATFLIYAKKDVFCRGQAEKLIERLKENNVYFESYCSVSLLDNHCFSLEWKSKRAIQANLMQSKFLKKIKNNKINFLQNKNTD